ncbi:ARM REPEAT PROTEIN INTERACTING WITH ABF2 [Tetrabaena socialis]|uniref:ARM REPEAT PROTEIN INTERACTING WITH ABF2 n=1 Tax=Tetrabaena socialis TaxID=47790 RepID=A0A2J7ZVZ1_9CHLO|nr:ARM REPEAT PROTEIN INTERACTING WITH ABF2 [Tetrabaena socialis]|eukprot:PNH04451.1 ARM REPEAT PROTEIN INTERACTING WITH ABF2 [Tetrabaena socialis]
MHLLCCTIPVACCNGVVSRILPGSQPGEAASTQTLACVDLELRPLTGADGLSGLDVGPPLQLYADPAARDGEPVAARRPYTPTRPLESPAWDSFSSAVYLIEGDAIVRLASDNTVTVVAGIVSRADEQDDVLLDGPGRAARFSSPARRVSAGAGALYLTDGDGHALRKLQLPGVGGGPAPALAAAAGRAVGGAAGGQQAAAVAADGEVLMSTLPHRFNFWGLAFDCSRRDAGDNGSGSLLFTTSTAIYRLPLGDPNATPSLVAGAEGVQGDGEDGRGPDARFNNVMNIVLDGEGCLYVAHYVPEHGTTGTTTLCRVAVDGAVTTIVRGLSGRLYHIAILPNGCVVLTDLHGALHVLGLGLKLPRSHAAAAPLPLAAPAGPPPRTLPADLGALLDRQPDGTADLTIVVGDRTFHVHRLLLCARSDYFLRMFAAGFVEDNAQQLILPEADPDAFELWLRFVYTGAVDIPTAQAKAVVELANQLLVPELRDQAAAVVEASVSAGTLVDLLLWAEERDLSVAGLLSRLKGWYIANYEAVMREAKEAVRRLMTSSPDLYFELTCELLPRRLLAM